MIQRPRDRSDEHGVPIRPGDDWFARSGEATETAKREGGAHEVSSLYKDTAVTVALEELFDRKCAYCETSIANQSWDVEHFRPKGRVAERADHPGYYWLAYEWTNLYPSCEFCNQRRRDKPLWGDLRFADTAGKLDQFPLEDEDGRAMDHQGDPAAERPLLLDPCGDPPEEHFRYDVLGQILPAPNDPRAEATIAICHLGRRRLRDLRRQRIEAVALLLKKIREIRESGNEVLAADLEGFLEEFYCGDSREHAGAARYVRKDPDAFGV